MKYSMLVCTLNRKELLRKCISSLLSQSFTDYEIIIVDQSDEVNLEYQSVGRIKYYHIMQRGLSHARNTGLKYATGEYVCLIDDDATYKSNYLETAEQFLNGKNVGILCGRVIDPITGEYYLYKIKRNTLTRITYSTAFSYCVSASMVIQRGLLDDGFDEDFGIGAQYGSGEESDIVFRALERKKSVYFCPKLQLFHKACSHDFNEKKLFLYSEGTGALLKKYYLCRSRIKYGLLFGISILRSTVGCVLFYLGNNEYKRSTVIIKGKLVGFKKYKGKS